MNCIQLFYFFGVCLSLSTGALVCSGIGLGQQCTLGDDAQCATGLTCQKLPSQPTHTSFGFCFLNPAQQCGGVAAECTKNTDCCSQTCLKGSNQATGRCASLCAAWYHMLKDQGHVMCRQEGQWCNPNGAPCCDKNVYCPLQTPTGWGKCTAYLKENDACSATTAQCAPGLFCTNGRCTTWQSVSHPIIMVAQEGESCGGGTQFAKSCAAGLKCQYPEHPAGWVGGTGTCVKS